MIVIFAVLAVVGWMLYQNNTLPIFNEFQSSNPDEVEAVPGEDDEVENPGTVVNPPATPAPGKCYVGGCSAQICSEEPDMASTCEYREVYACYRTAKCERQPNGACGWTPTTELSMCIQAAE